MSRHDERRRPPAGRRRGRPSRPPGLTDRQVAVLAAIERLDGPSVLTVAHQVGLVPASRTASVVIALEARGLVRLEGDPSLLHVGGVRLYPARRRSRPFSADLDALADLLRCEGLCVYEHDSGIAVKVPLADLEAELGGEPAGLLDAVRRAVALARGRGIRCSLSVNTRVTNIRGVPALEVLVSADRPPTEVVQL